MWAAGLPTKVGAEGARAHAARGTSVRGLGP